MQINNVGGPNPNGPKNEQTRLESFVNEVKEDKNGCKSLGDLTHKIAEKYNQKFTSVYDKIAKFDANKDGHLSYDEMQKLKQSDVWTYYSELKDVDYDKDYPDSNTGVIIPL